MGIFLSSSFSFAADACMQACPEWTFCNSATNYNCVANTQANQTQYNYTPEVSTTCATGDVFCNCISGKPWATDSNIAWDINLNKNNVCCYEEGRNWIWSWYPLCKSSELNENSWTNTSTSAMGITCNEDQLTNGQCKLNIYDTLGIRKSVRNTNDPTSVGLFVQDIVLSATFFIGTLITIALVVSGLMFIFAASSGKDPANAKKWIMWSLIWLLIVVSSYVIIRLVQYIAKGF